MVRKRREKNPNERKDRENKGRVSREGRTRGHGRRYKRKSGGNIKTGGRKRRDRGKKEGKREGEEEI